MLWIKICGMTLLEDALAAADAGADAVGFVFAPSPRRIHPEKARLIAERLPGHIETVGVFVDAPFEEVAALDWLTTVQLHGSEPPEFAAALPQRRKIKAFRLSDGSDVPDSSVLSEWARCCDRLLVDAFVPGLAGGTGKRLDPRLALAIKSCGCPLILAGGLDPASVADAVRTVRPFGVDVSSGVEHSPGVKNHWKIKEFIKNARNADQRP